MSATMWWALGICCVASACLLWRLLKAWCQVDSVSLEAAISQLGRPLARALLLLGLEPWWRRQLIRAGCLRVDPQSYLSLVLGQALLVSVLLALLGTAVFSWGWALSVSGLSAVMLWMWRLRQLRYQWQLQRQQLRRELPFLFDLLIMAVESGAGFQLALQKVYDFLPTPAAQSLLKQVLEQIRAGVSRPEALQNLAVHMQMEELEQWAWTLEQVEQFGLSLAPMLRVQASELRQRQLLRGEQKALQAPLKMLLPLSVCLLPCTFLVLLLGLGGQLLPLLQA